jgi:hypothetical protein
VLLYYFDIGILLHIINIFFAFPLEMFLKANISNSKLINRAIDNRHTYVYKLYSSYRRLVPLFVRGRHYTGAFQVKRKEASPILLISHSAI